MRQSPPPRGGPAGSAHHTRSQTSPDPLGPGVPKGPQGCQLQVDLCSQESLPPKSGIAGPGPVLSNESHTRLRLEEAQLLGPRTS